MTICAIKVCRNYRGRLRTNNKVTYHRIPNDPVLRARWVEIIRRSRGEDGWQPAQSTVICSDHFRAKDMYFVNNQNRRRLTKKAIPRKALFLTSLETDDESEIEDTGTTSERVPNVSDDTPDATSACDISIVKTERLEEQGASSARDDPLETGCESPSGLSDIGSDDLEGALDTPLVTRLIQQLLQMKKQLKQKENQLNNKDNLLKLKDGKINEKDNKLKENETEINALAAANNRLKLKNRNMKRILLKLKRKVLDINPDKHKSEDSSEEESA